MVLEPNQEKFDASEGLVNAADDEELYIEVLELFLQDARKNDKQLGEYIECEDWENYQILIHALKNNLRIAGAHAAGEAALDMEMHCKNGDFDYIKEHHTAFLEEEALAKRYIRQYLRDKV